MSYTSPHHLLEENLIDLSSLEDGGDHGHKLEISGVYHQTILPLCDKLEKLTNLMGQGTKAVKVEDGTSQFEQRGGCTQGGDKASLSPQVVTHEMKLRIFSGTPDSVEQINVDEWIAEAKRNIRLLGYKGQAAVNYVLKFLSGPAQRRVEKVASNDGCDCEGIFRILRDAYGENLTISELQGRFYQRVQGEMENVWTFADALEVLYDGMVKVSPALVVSRPDQLKEVFLKGLRDPELKNGLHWYVRSQPGLSYEELVQVAAEESRRRAKQVVRPKSQTKGHAAVINECSSVTKESGGALTPHEGGSRESEIGKMLTELRLEVQAVKSEVAQIRGSPVVEKSKKGRPSPFQGECYVCGQWGHRAATCWHRTQISAWIRGRGRGGPPRGTPQGSDTGAPSTRVTGVSEVSEEGGNGNPLLPEAQQ